MTIKQYRCTVIELDEVYVAHPSNARNVICLAGNPMSAWQGFAVYEPHFTLKDRSGVKWDDMNGFFTHVKSSIDDLVEANPDITLDGLYNKLQRVRQFKCSRRINNKIDTIKEPEKQRQWDGVEIRSYNVHGNYEIVIPASLLFKHRVKAHVQAHRKRVNLFRG